MIGSTEPSNFMKACNASSTCGVIAENIKGVLALMFCMVISITASASTGAPGWLEESLYATGKYNTVTAVVGIILLGLTIWLFTLDKKLKRLEEKIERPGN